jgi:hypothetical protein
MIVSFLGIDAPRGAGMRGTAASLHSPIVVWIVRREFARAFVVTKLALWTETRPAVQALFVLTAPRILSQRIESRLTEDVKPCSWSIRHHRTPLFIRSIQNHASTIDQNTHAMPSSIVAILVALVVRFAFQPVQVTQPLSVRIRAALGTLNRDKRDRLPRLISCVVVNRFAARVRRFRWFGIAPTVPIRERSPACVADSGPPFRFELEPLCFSFGQNPFVVTVAEGKTLDVQAIHRIPRNTRQNSRTFAAALVCVPGVSSCPSVSLSVALPS